MQAFMVDAMAIQPQPVVQLPEAPARFASNDFIEHLNDILIALHADAGRRYHAVRESFTTLQACVIDIPCSFTRISAACRFTDGPTVFSSAHP